jgi:hypothetical protein
MEDHHVFGASNKKNSEKYGMKIRICHWCHNEPLGGIHHNRVNELKLKREYQAKFEAEHPELNFLSVFGKNYL